MQKALFLEQHREPEEKGILLSELSELVERVNLKAHGEYKSLRPTKSP